MCIRRFGMWRVRICDGFVGDEVQGGKMGEFMMTGIDLRDCNSYRFPGGWMGNWVNTDTLPLPHEPGFVLFECIALHQGLTYL